MKAAEMRYPRQDQKINFRELDIFKITTDQKNTKDKQIQRINRIPK